MEKAATSNDLKKCFSGHLEETQGHVERLEQAFELLGKKATAKKCEAMSGLIDEAEEIIKETETDTMVRDAALIVAGQKVEHYEIASYGSLCAFAKQMGHDKVASLLEQTLKEEKGADQKLNKLALTCINEEAEDE